MRRWPRRRRWAARDFTDAELRVAAKLRPQLYKLNADVSASGFDKAPWHAGVIVQPVEAAFASEGLDATDYGFFVREEVEPGVFITGIRYSQLILWLMALLLAERPPVA